MVDGTALLDEVPQTAREPRRRMREPGAPIHLHGVRWEDYVELCDLFGEVHIRTSFIGGEVEIMTLSYEHEFWAAWLSQIVEVLTEELDIPRASAGMTTFRREDLQRGLEPDRCYYFGENEPRVRGRKRLDLSVDPPPDLAVEVEITRSAARRMEIYAALGVPEAWRFDGTTLTIHRRTDAGEYVAAERSGYFPLLPMTQLLQFLQRRGEVSETELVKSFREWVRQQIAAGWASGSV